MFSLTQWSAQIHTGFHVLRATQVPPEFDWVLTYGAVTLCGGSFQNSSVNLLDLLFYPVQIQGRYQGAASGSRIAPQHPIPNTQHLPEFERDSGGPTTPIGKPIGLGFSAFARRYLQNLFDFFSSGYLDVSVHRVPSTQTMNSSVGHKTLLSWGFPIRIRLDQRFCAAPQAVSPLTRPSSATCP